MAKVVTITQYEANDGSLFLTEAECNAHDFKLENGAAIDAAAEAYANTMKLTDRSRSMQVNTVSAFLAFYLPWVEAGKPEVERTVFDTPKDAPVVAEAAVAEVAEAVEEQPAGDQIF